MTHTRAAIVAVRGPFRLDLTVDALRRLASNAVDLVDSDGTYRRAFDDGEGGVLLEVRQRDPQSMEVRVPGRNAERWAAAASRMLGLDADLTEWYARSATIPWLRPIAQTLRGLRPPRYPTLWEACAHAIVFAQISIVAAGAIMRRAVEALGTRVHGDGVSGIVFPSPQRWIDAGEEQLRGAGLSRNKIAHLRAAASAFAQGLIDEAQLERRSTPDAAEQLCCIRGIGPWSASVVLLRGLGRLDTFPLRDSGVARSLTALSGRNDIDQGELLERLGPARGMLYYHLLLGRMRNLATPGSG